MFRICTGKASPTVWVRQVSHRLVGERRKPPSPPPHAFLSQRSKQSQIPDRRSAVERKAGMESFAPEPEEQKSFVVCRRQFFLLLGSTRARAIHVWAKSFAFYSKRYLTRHKKRETSSQVNERCCSKRLPGARFTEAAPIPGKTQRLRLCCSLKSRVACQWVNVKASKQLVGSTVRLKNAPYPSQPPIYSV